LNDVRSYVPPVGIGEKMRGATLATVVYSKISGIQAGDVVLAPVLTASISAINVWLGRRVV